MRAQALPNARRKWHREAHADVRKREPLFAAFSRSASTKDSNSLPARSLAQHSPHIVAILPSACQSHGCLRRTRAVSVLQRAFLELFSYPPHPSPVFPRLSPEADLAIRWGKRGLARGRPIPSHPHARACARKRGVDAKPPIESIFAIPPTPSIGEPRPHLPKVLSHS